MNSFMIEGSGQRKNVNLADYIIQNNLTEQQQVAKYDYLCIIQIIKHCIALAQNGTFSLPILEGFCEVIPNDPIYWEQGKLGDRTREMEKLSDLKIVIIKMIQRAKATQPNEAQIK